MQTKKLMAQNPLILMMALAVPGMSHAVGLGEIHVRSSLNEPLVAEIDIVGATPEDLLSLHASMANRDTFARFNADKPAFLSTATFKVAQNAAGRSVLEVRSRDAFNEPAVDMVVDVRWHNGAVTRQYSLLLDPAEMSFGSRIGEQLRTAGTPAAPSAVSPIPAPRVPLTRVKIGAKATLRGVAWRAGARSEADLQRMMMAMFRANPAAFDGNINRLRTGAFIDIPAPEIVAAISQADAHDATAAQMATWRASKGPAAKATATAASTATTTAAVAAPVAIAPAASVTGDENAALKQRVQSLEKSLSDMQTLIDHENDKLAGIQARVVQAEASATPPSIPQHNSVDHSLFAQIAGGLAALAGILGIFYWRGKRREQPRSANLPPAFATEPAAIVLAAPLAASTVVTEVRLPATPQGATQEDDDALLDAWISERDHSKAKTPDVETDTVVLEKTPDPAEEEDTVNLASDTASMPAATVTIKRPEAPLVDGTDLLEAISAELEREYENSTRLDYNLIELDKAQKEIESQAANRQPEEVHEFHLDESTVSQERPFDLEDSLKQAISLEPERPDLKLKLLETYYAQAATNRAAFLEVVQQFAAKREQLTPQEWDKITEMGRQIASDTDLFSHGPDDSDHNIADFAA